MFDFNSLSKCGCLVFGEPLNPLAEHVTLPGPPPCRRAEAGPDAKPAKLTKEMLENPTSGCGSVSPFGGRRVAVRARHVGHAMRSAAAAAAAAALLLLLHNMRMVQTCFCPRLRLLHSERRCCLTTPRSAG